MIRENQKFFVVKHLRMRDYLEEHGYHWFKIETDKDNPAFSCWVYDLRQDGIREVLNEYVEHANRYCK